MAESGEAQDPKAAAESSSGEDVEYVAGRCLELAGQLTVPRKKKKSSSKKVAWEGPVDQFEDALDAAVGTLEDLCDDIESASVEPSAASEVNPESGTVTVTRASGEALSIPCRAEDSVSDVRSRTASKLQIWPCQVSLFKGETELLDDEKPTLGDAFSVVCKDIVAEAKAIAEELARSMKIIKKKKAPEQLELYPEMPSIRRVFVLAAGPLLRISPVDADFGMWAARILEGLFYDHFSELKLYDGIDAPKRKQKKKPQQSCPPLLLLGRALAASDGGAAAAALFFDLCQGERWCAADVGRALQGAEEPGPCNGEPGEGSALACAFRRAVEGGSEPVVLNLLLTTLSASEVDSGCAAPIASAGMARMAALACKQRSEDDIRTVGGALLTSLLDALWPGRGNELKGNEVASKALVDDLVASGLATRDAQDSVDLIPQVAPFLTRGAIGERLGHDTAAFHLQDVVEEFEESSGARGAAWD